MFCQILLLLSIQHFAQANVLDWRDFVQATLGNNPDLASSQKSFEASVADLRASYSGYLPTVGLDARASHGITVTDPTQVLAGVNSTYSQRSTEYSASVGWNLFEGFATVATVGISRAARDEAEADRAAKSAELRYQLRQAYLKAVIDVEKIHLAEKILAREKDNARFIELKYNSGTEAKWNVLSTKAGVAQANFSLHSAQADLHNQLDGLARLSGLTALNAENFPTSEGYLHENIDSHFDLDANPSFRKADLNVQKAEKSKQLANSKFMPSLNASYSWDKQKIEGSPWTKGKSYLVYLDLNIFNGGSDFFGVQKTKALLSGAEFDRESARRTLTEAYTKALRDYQTALENIPVTESSLEATNERVRTVTTQYRNGLANYLDWEQAQSILTTAEQAVVDAKEQVLLDRAALENAIGYTLEQI